MIEVIGKGGISAKVIADSIAENGKRMTTFEINLPKVLLAENNTHRVLSKNFSSSRAIPNANFVDIESFEPIFWGKNKSGMMADDSEIDNIPAARNVWNAAIEMCKAMSEKLNALGLHKQHANRLNDWHTMARGVMSGTDWDNFSYLRNDIEAQPEFEELANCIDECFYISSPVKLLEGEWHLPYVKSERIGGVMKYFDSDSEEISLDIAKKISASCCGQVSYRKMNDSREKALDIFNKLFSGRRPHLSPVEHQATPIVRSIGLNIPFEVDTWDTGVTHVDRTGILHSGNLTGWIQYRQTLPNNVYVKQ